MLYVDLDGVFADFNRKIDELGLKRNDPHTNWPIIDKIPHFFSDLELLPDALELWDAIKIFNPVILTAAPKKTNQLITCVNDKVRWVHENLDSNIPVIVSDGWEGKINYLDDADILLDDMQRNIDLWDAHGGIGILHTDAKSSIDKIFKLYDSKFFTI